MTEALYDSFIADYYDESPLVRDRTQDAAFYCQAARDFGDPILELGCGTGRITMALGHMGQRVTGLDLSKKMLEHAAKKRITLQADQRDRVRLVQGDMTKFELGEKFHLVIIPFRPFQHLLGVEQQMDCLDCVRKHLIPGGHLILDVFQTDPERMYDPVHQRETPLVDYQASDGRQVRISERIAAFHRAVQQNDVEMIYSVTHPDGKLERLVFAWPLRYFFRYEVEHLLARCGFRVAAEYGNFDRTPIQKESPEMIFVSEAGL